MYYCVSYLVSYICWTDHIIQHVNPVLWCQPLAFYQDPNVSFMFPVYFDRFNKNLLQILCYIIFWNWSKIFVCLSCPRYKNIRYNKNQYLNLYWMVCWGWDWVEYKKLLHYKYNDLISISNSDTCMVSNTRES